MHDNVMNEYVLDTGTASLTDWVLTYPTKRYYVATGTGTPGKLFQRNFAAEVVYDTLHDGQAKPCPARRGTGSRLVDAVETLGQPRYMLGLDAWAVIAHRDHGLLALAARTELGS